MGWVRLPGWNTGRQIKNKRIKNKQIRISR